MLYLYLKVSPNTLNFFRRLNILMQQARDVKINFVMTIQLADFEIHNKD